MPLQPLRIAVRTLSAHRTAAVRRLPSKPLTFAVASAGLFTTSAANMSAPKVNKSEEQWRAELSPEQFRVLRQKGTEAPGSSKYDKQYPGKGVYTCAGCDAPLYTASTKFKSGCGWPSYFDSIPGAVTRHEENSGGMQRTEIICSNCGGHLGHVFKGEGFGVPTDERHCVNGISINFKEDE